MVGVRDDAVLRALAGGGRKDQSNWDKAIKLLQTIAEKLVSEVDGVRKVQVTNPELPVRVEGYGKELRGMYTHYGQKDMMQCTVIQEVDYWRNVYGIGGGDLRQALPVVVVDSTRKSSAWKHSMAVRQWPSGLTDEGSSAASGEAGRD